MKDPGKPFGTQLPPRVMRDLRHFSIVQGIPQSEAVATALRAWLRENRLPGAALLTRHALDGHPERLHTRLPVALIARVKARAARRSIRVYDAVTEAVSAWVVAARKEVAK
jgi:hypothetical protein